MSTLAHMNPGKRTSPGPAFPGCIRVSTTTTGRYRGSRLLLLSSARVAASAVVAALKAKVGNTALRHSQPEMRTVMEEQGGALKTTQSLLWRHQRDTGSFDPFL